MNRKIAVRGIFVIDGKLLCVKHKPYRARTHTDFWCTPGGGVDNGESLHHALEREVVEELGVTPLIGNLLYIQQFAHQGKENLEFFFHILNPHDYLHIDLAKTSHGSKEIETIDFIQPNCHTILPSFLTRQLLANLEDQPTKIFDCL